jgi:hypothetical protein
VKTAARFALDTKPVSGPSELVQDLSDSALASPFRSTVPLLALTKDAWPEFVNMLARCRVVGDVCVAFERTVSSARGEGRPSYTDAMVLSDENALAIEAKWTEPRYETVATRLARAGLNGKDPEELTKGSREFVTGWLELLQPYSTKPLRLDDFAGCVYQIVHRAASACAMGKAPMLAYLHFMSMGAGGASSEQYLGDLAQVHALLGSPHGFPFYLVDLPLQPTRAFDAIRHLKKGVPETGQAVKAALLASELFEFGKPQVRRIGVEL